MANDRGHPAAIALARTRGGQICRCKEIIVPRTDGYFQEPLDYAELAAKVAKLERLVRELQHD